MIDRLERGRVHSPARVAADLREFVERNGLVSDVDLPLSELAAAAVQANIHQSDLTVVSALTET